SSRADGTYRWEQRALKPVWKKPHRDRAAKRNVQKSTDSGESSKVSTIFSRLCGSLLATNSRIRFGGGKVPVRSRQTRRRNSASLDNPEGTMLNLRSLANT